MKISDARFAILRLVITRKGRTQMTKTEQVKEIFNKLEDEVSDLNEKDAVLEAEEKILTIITLLETKIKLMTAVLIEVYKMDDDLFANTFVEALKNNENN